jgi:Protein of unknown function (DUF3096)
VDGRREPGHDEFPNFPGMVEPNGGLRVNARWRPAASHLHGSQHSRTTKPTGNPMIITAAHITPLVALIAGILILVMPRLLNYVVAVYLIIVGLMGLNGIYHFVH